MPNIIKDMAQIRSFRESPSLPARVGTALIYAFFGGVVLTYSEGAMGGLLSIFFLIGILLWVFVVHRKAGSYFLRYHLFQALLLNVSLGAIIWVFVSAMALMETIPWINIVSQYMTLGFLGKIIQVANTIQLSFKDVCLFLLSLFMVVQSLRGTYQEVPWITDGVRYWI